ncbi:hypothetical protein, partial [Paenibacillus sp. 7516]|uniref:hypothetical protein n=1 Tax=Paenibacillus sp. 7516 TaxID=2022549 RepID=UPI000BD13EFB
MRAKINYVLVWLIFCAVLLWLLRFLYFNLHPDTPDIIFKLMRLIGGMGYAMGVIAAGRFLISEFKIQKEE